MTKNLIEGWYTMKPIDKERYQQRDGLEGPFQTKAGKVVYYDPREGSYYDPDTDMYLSYDEWRELNESCVYTVEYTSQSGKCVPMSHKTFEIFSEAVAFGKAGVAGGSYRSFEVYEQVELDESWSDGINSRTAHVHARTAAQYRNKAKDAASIAKRYEKGSPEHSKYMAAHHSAMAKSIKSSYHGGEYPNMAISKRDHKEEMDKAKEYKSSMSEQVELDENLRAGVDFDLASKEYKGYVLGGEDDSDEDRRATLWGVYKAMGDGTYQQVGSVKDPKSNGKYSVSAYSSGVPYEQFKWTVDNYLSAGQTVSESITGMKKAVIAMIKNGASKAEVKKRYPQLQDSDVDGFFKQNKVTEASVESNTSAESFKLKVTNPATGNSEMQEFNSESALKDYAARSKQKGLKVSRVKSQATNEADSVQDLAIQAIQSKLKKAKVSYRDPNAKTAREEDRIAKMLAAKAKKKNESAELDEANTSYEKDMDHDKAVVIRGVKGVKSTPFRKKFKNMAAYSKWSDTEAASDYEVHDVMNEAYINTNMDAIQVLGNLRKISKSIELGQSSYSGNLAGEYANNVWDVYNFIEAKTKGFQNIDNNAKAAVDAMMQLRKVAKGMEREPGSGSNAQFANQVVNTLYPVMQYLDSIKEESVKVAEAAVRTGSYKAYNIVEANVPGSPYNDMDRETRQLYQNLLYHGGGGSWTAQKAAQAEKNRATLAASADYHTYTKEDVKADSSAASEKYKEVAALFNKEKAAGTTGRWPGRKLMALKKAGDMLSDLPRYFETQWYGVTGYGARWDGKEPWDGMDDKRKAGIVRSQMQIKKKKEAVNELMAKIGLDPIQFTNMGVWRSDEGKKMNESYQDEMKKIMGAIDAARAAMPALQADGDMRKVAALKAEVEDIIYAVNKGGNTDMHIAKIHELLSSNVAEAALGNSNELRREVVAIFQELAAKLNSGEDITDDIVDELGDLHNDVLRSKDPELKYWYKRVRTIEPSRWKEALSKASRVLALSESKSPAYDKDTVDSIKKKSAMNEDISQDAHHMQQDHEVQMARSDLYKTANYAIKLHSLLKGVSEAEGIEGWMQAKITKAADYLGSVFHALEYDMIEKSAPVMPTMESPQPVAEAMRLDRDNLIHADADAQQFAKHYRAGMAGDYRAGGPSDKDTANSEKFHEIYDYEHTRSGFAGSGTTVYTNRKTGEQFEVDRNPNGKGFYGTDHYVSVVKNLGEAVAKIACVKCDEVSTAAAWKNNNGFCPKCKTSSQGVAESSDYAKRRKAADDEYYGKKKPTPAAKTVVKTDYQKRRETNEAASFKLKVTNPATGNSETQEFNSETALKDYTARAKQRGLKVSRVKSEVANEANATLGGAVNRAEKSRQSAIRKAKAWMKRTGKSAADAAKEFDLFKSDIAKLEETTAGGIAAVVMPMGRIQKRKK
jgi:hypothetical protein